jgi:hypothetical protein
VASTGPKPAAVRPSSHCMQPVDALHACTSTASDRCMLASRPTGQRRRSSARRTSENRPGCPARRRTAAKRRACMTHECRMPMSAPSALAILLQGRPLA